MTEIEAMQAVTAGASAAKYPVGGGIPYVVTPERYAVTPVEHLLPTPIRKRCVTVFPDLDSFCRYVNGQKDERCQVFADRALGRIEAMIDGFGTATPDWAEHQAVLALETDDAWKAWLAIHKKAQSQEALAEFLEEWAENVVTPDAGTLADLVSNLEVTKNVRYCGAVRLQDGAFRIAYDEAVAGKGGGEVVIPARLTLGLKRYKGETKPYKVEARLRYRLVDTQLRFTVLFDHPDRVEEAAFDAVLSDIEQATGIKPFLGTFRRR